MNGYFAYVRVSTVKQGEKGSSLQEQKAAIEAYARRLGLSISQWFEETETAAKRGRPIFTTMLQALERQSARGVITHKIDRSARNLRDWAALGELLDRGIELHFAHESIDLSSRGGRLSADIQAVVAADYIRNLRDEVRKGFYGRLKQGLYPLQAPVGYLDRGGGVAKAIDPVRGPLIAKAFELYATGQWSLEKLSNEFFTLGLRTNSGARVTRIGFSRILNNPFYAGLIRIRKTGELFDGVHAPLISVSLFDRVQAVLRGRITHKANINRFRYQRLLRCSSCNLSLIASRHKGRVYYRCQTRSCPTTCLRQDKIDECIREATRNIQFTASEWAAIRADVAALLSDQTIDIADGLRNIALAIQACDERLGRLTDAYVDKIVERELYLSRKDQALRDRTALFERKHALETGQAGVKNRAAHVLELLEAFRNMPDLENDERVRELLARATSNFEVDQKKVVVTWAEPFDQLFCGDTVAMGGPARGKPRTAAQRASKILAEYTRKLAEVNSPITVRQVA
ncbi:MAG: recombinase family protein [Alphaproteobacteria bacterium]|nr:recombinase family protein [Alphaproteobacteria bacterium]